MVAPYTGGLCRCACVCAYVRTYEHVLTYSCCCQIEEAKHEVRELVEFLKNPARFERLGAKLPKGGVSHSRNTYVHLCTAQHTTGCTTGFYT